MVAEYRKRVDRNLLSQIDKRNLIRTVNRQLLSLGYEIKKVDEVVSNEVYYMLIDKNCESQRKIQESLWSKKEVKLFFLIFDAIMSRPNEENDETGQPFQRYSTKLTNAVNLSRQAELTMVLADKLIRTWIDRHFFVQIGDSSITLGIRAIIEYRDCLEKKYELRYENGQWIDIDNEQSDTQEV